MYCKNCGKEVNQGAEFCTACGSRPLNGNSYCQNCGASVNANQEICIKCGVRLNNQVNNSNNSSSANEKLFCRNCGSEVSKNAEICTSCGSRPLSGKSFCQNCGSHTNENQEVCIKCGVRLVNKNTNYQSSGNSYLPPYYQEEFAKIRQSNEEYKGKWNWCAFFFSWIWAFTKGMWGLALINLAINLVLGAATEGFGFIFGIVISVLWGLRGNYFYYNLHTNNKQMPNKF